MRRLRRSDAGPRRCSQAPSTDFLIWIPRQEFPPLTVRRRERNKTVETRREESLFCAQGPLTDGHSRTDLFLVTPGSKRYACRSRRSFWHGWRRRLLLRHCCRWHLIMRRNHPRVQSLRTLALKLRGRKVGDWVRMASACWQAPPSTTLSATAALTVPGIAAGRSVLTSRRWRHVRGGESDRCSRGAAPQIQPSRAPGSGIAGNRALRSAPPTK